MSHPHPVRPGDRAAGPWRWLPLMLVAALAACETPRRDPVQALAPVESRDVNAATATAGAGAAGGRTDAGQAQPVAPQSGVATVNVGPAGAGAGLDAATAALARPGARVVYFDFDSFAIRDDFKPVLEAHARVLSSQRQRGLVIEGHTDERGGREYNLALGQKRAEAVLRSLTLLGAQESQLEAVSFGKERPAVAGSDESAWAKNRRAELKDR